MNNPNHPNLGRAHTSPGLNQQQSNMTDYYGADNDYMNEGGQDDALQMHPVDHLESMSKLPVHKRRFSVNSFPHAFQKPQNAGYQRQDEPVYDEITGDDEELIILSSKKAPPALRLARRSSSG